MDRKKCYLLKTNAFNPYGSVTSTCSHKTSTLQWSVKQRSRCSSQQNKPHIMTDVFVICLYHLLCTQFSINDSPFLWDIGLRPRFIQDTRQQGDGDGSQMVQEPCMDFVWSCCFVRIDITKGCIDLVRQYPQQVWLAGCSSTKSNPVNANNQF